MGAAASALTVSAVPGLPWSIVSLDADLRIRLMRFSPSVMATLLHEARNALRSFRTTEWLNADTLELVLHESLDLLDRSRLSLCLTRALAHAEYSARLSLRIAGTDCCIFIGGARDDESLSSFSLLPLGDSRLRLSFASPSVNSLLERCIQRAYPAGLHSLRSIDEHTDEYALVGMPWSSSGELRVDADRLLLEMTRVLARNGWRLHSRFGRLIIYSFAEAEIVSTRRPSLSLSLFSHNLITFTGLPRSHQKEVDLALDCTEQNGSWMGETYRVVLSGSPWLTPPLVSSRGSVVHLLCSLFSTLLRLHWLPSPIALSPNGLLFTASRPSPVDQNRPKRRVMCAAAVWITEDNEVSLTNFPSTVNDLLVSTARRHFGIIRSDRPSVAHYRIRATVLSSTMRMHALLTVFLNELSLIGWRPMTSLQLFDNSKSDQVNVIFVLPDESLVRERNGKEKSGQCRSSL